MARFTFFGAGAPLRTLFVLLLCALIGGCASTQKRFERARDFEARGDYLAASHEYIDVLERESDWSEARTRLRFVGPIAVDSLLAQAHRYEAAARYPDAVDELDRLDDLRAEATDVSVTLEVPSDYAQYRRKMVDNAIAFYEGEAAEAESAGAWKDALATYDRALRYEMEAPRREDIHVRMASVHLRWAEDEMDAEHFRSAFSHAEAGLELAAREADLSERLAVLQDDALGYGTRGVAMLPLMAASGWENAAPRSFLSDLDAAVNYEYWTKPPLFVATIDQGEVRREIRDLGLARRNIDRQDAARIGRALDVDYVLVGEMRRYDESEEIRREDTERVRLRGTKQDTTYVIRTIEVKLESSGRFQLVNPRDGRMLREFDVSASDRAEYKRGSYNGDVSTLDLSRREQDYFGAHLRADAVHDAQDRLLEKLSEQIARRSFDAVLDRIP